jgi:hypothetical protein
MKLELEQKKSLSNYLSNMSISWFAAGIIGPFVTKQSFTETKGIIIFSALVATIFLILMLILLKKGKRKK